MTFEYGTSRLYIIGTARNEMLARERRVWVLRLQIKHPINTDAVADQQPTFEPVPHDRSSASLLVHLRRRSQCSSS